MKRLNLLYLAGVLVIALGFFASPTPGWAAYLDHQTPDITAGGLNQPAKVAVDSANGDVYVTDAGNKMVKKFDKNGNYLSGFSVSGTPVGIAVNSNNIFVGDTTNKCVWVFNKSGVAADLLGTGGTHKLGGNSNFWKTTMPNTVAIAPTGHIFVVDGDSDKCLIYDRNGYFLYAFGIGSTATSNGLVINLFYPSGITFSTGSMAGDGKTWTQYFYIGDQGNSRVQKLHYVYDTYTNIMTTKPTFDAVVGTGKGDAFAKFLRIADLAWDNNNRLIVLDSLQQVGQVFNSTGGSLGIAANYSGSAVLNQLNIPTGAAVDIAAHKLYIANNQAGSLSVYSTTDGTLPTLAVTTPATAETPCTLNYTVNYNGTVVGSSVTVKLYYSKIKDAAGNPISNPSSTLFATQTPTVTSGSFSGSATLDLVGTYPNFMWAGTYSVYAIANDPSNNYASATAPGSVAITIVSGKRRYTCSMQARFGTFELQQDTDLDGVYDGDEIDGTFNAAFGYAATDPLSADSDKDGLDDGVEEGVKPLNQNTIITLASTSTVHTDPNSADTDGGGISDAIEVVKGTNPNSGSDDLSSEPDVISAYFCDGAYRWETILGLMNAYPSTIYADITFFKLDGSVGYSAPAVKFGPNASMKILPYSMYGVSEGSVEIRTTQGAALGGFRGQYLACINGGGNYDTGYSSSLVYSPATHAYVPYMDSQAYRFQGYINLKNALNSSIQVTGTYSKTQDASGNIISPPTITTKSYTLLPHETKHLDPAAEVGSGGGEFIVAFDSNTPKSIVGSYYQNRYNASDNTLWDYGQEEPLQVSPSTVSYCSLFDDSFARFKGWYSVMSPGINTATANVNVSFNMTGSTANTNLLGFYTKNFTVSPGSYYAQRYYADLTTPDVTRTPTPSGAIPSPNYGEGAFKVTSDVPVFADLANFRYNSTQPSVYDYGFAVPNATSTSSALFCGYFDDSNEYRYKTWFQIGNPSETATVTVTASFYAPDGSLLTPTLTPVITYPITIGPRSNFGFRPSQLGYAEGSTIGSAKIVSTGGEIFGYLLFQKWNIAGNQNYYDYGMSCNLTPIPYPPAPVQLRVSNVSSSEVDLAWEANPSFNLAGYNVYRTTTSGSGYVKINGAPVTGTTYADTTVSTGTSYYYVLKAVDNNSNLSGTSGEVIARP